MNMIRRASAFSYSSTTNATSHAITRCDGDKDTIRANLANKTLDFLINTICLDTLRKEAVP